MTPENARRLARLVDDMMEWAGGTRVVARTSHHERMGGNRKLAPGILGSKRVGEDIANRLSQYRPRRVIHLFSGNFHEGHRPMGFLIETSTCGE